MTQFCAMGVLLASGSAAKAQLFVNDPFFGVTRYTLNGTNPVVDSPVLGNGSQGMGYSNGTVYVSAYNENVITTIDPSTMTAANFFLRDTSGNTVSTDPDNGFTAGGGNLYVFSGNGDLTAYNSTTGRQSTAFTAFNTTSSGADGQITYAGGNLFVSVGNDKVNEYNGTTGGLITSITSSGTSAQSLGANGNFLYISTGTDILAYNLTANTFTDLNLNTGNTISYISATNNDLFVSSKSGGDILKYSLSSGGTVATLDSNFGPLSDGAGAILAFEAVSAPEPSTTAMLILGFSSLLLLVRRHKVASR